MLKIPRLISGIIVLALMFLVSLPMGCGGGSKAKKLPSGIPAPAGPVPFTIEAKPDFKDALNDVYVAQKEDPVEVLKNWKVRYTAPAGVDNVKWYHGENEIGVGNPFERNEPILGSPIVKMEGTKDGNTVSETRKLIIGDVESIGFNLEIGGSYKKNDPKFPHYVCAPTLLNPPQKPAITMRGLVKRTNESPLLKKFLWGFVQGVQSLDTTKFYYINNLVQYHPSSKGSSARIREWYRYKSTIDKDGNLIFVNDARRGKQLYAGRPGQALGTDYQIPVEDTPLNRHKGFSKVFTDNLGISVIVPYIIQPHVFDDKLIVWHVVFHSDTEQYVPLARLGWRITYDSSDPGDFDPIMWEPPAELTKPTDYTTSSHDFARFEDGPWIIHKR